MPTRKIKVWKGNDNYMETTKTLDLTFARFCNENAELAKRNRVAAEYSANVQNRKATRKHNIAYKATRYALIGVLSAAILAGGIHAISSATREPRYAVATAEKQTNGHWYVYVTERICEVTEISGDIVTVEYDGQLYAFFGYGYKVGQKIVCQFTDDWEIVGVVE